MMHPSNDKCPCHSGKSYHECCAPFHQKKAIPDPISLMRSRYSAYALGNSAYILETTHPNHQDQKIPFAKRKRSIEEFSRETEFRNLEILGSEESPPYFYVTFRATLFQKGKDASFTEKSRFAKLGPRWFYLSGEKLPQSTQSTQRGVL
jgi:SEC-C motif domain protein